MKTLKIGAFAILGLLAVACNDDDDTTTKLSSQEQAEMVASAMGRSGFSGSAEQSAAYADDQSGSGRLAECGAEVSDDTDLSITLGGISIVYNSDFTLEVNCQGEEPESLSVAFDYEGSYNGPNFESSFGGNGDLMVNGLNNDDDEFELNGTYGRDGEFKVKAEGEVTEEGEHDLNIEAEDVMINKSSHMITSGKAYIDASGRIEGKGRYSFSADVDFEVSGGSRRAIIHVAGDTYELNIETNSLSKRSE
jgi:hypothetical protein